MGVITIPYKPRELQKEFHENKKRFSLMVCHRRFGKTVMVINQIIKDAMTSGNRVPKFAYIAPTYKQAKRIVWDYLKYYASVIPGTKFNESELRADFINGARIELFGADNPDSLRGIYLDGVVLDEYAQINPSLYTEVIRPALSDRKGYAIFIGTPKGKNHFYDLYKHAQESDWYVAVHKASDTGYIEHEELRLTQEEYHTRNADDEYNQEYECSFEAAIKGSFYGDLLNKAVEEQRVCEVSYDPNLEVHTAWDIGYRDDTSIIFFQTFGKEVRIIDAYSNSGMTLPEYIAFLRGKDYKYGKHFFPWDAKIKPMSSGKSTLDVAREYGLDTVELTPSLTVLEGINQARMIFRNCWFDKEKTKDLMNALSLYRREYDDKKQTFRANPLHDWTSHYADAFRYMAITADNKEPDNLEDYREAAMGYQNARPLTSNF